MRESVKRVIKKRGVKSQFYLRMRLKRTKVTNYYRLVTKHRLYIFQRVSE